MTLHIEDTNWIPIKPGYSARTEGDVVEEQKSSEIFTNAALRGPSGNTFNLAMKGSVYQSSLVSEYNSRVESENGAYLVNVIPNASYGEEGKPALPFSQFSNNGFGPSINFGYKPLFKKAREQYSSMTTAEQRKTLEKIGDIHFGFTQDNTEHSLILRKEHIHDMLTHPIDINAFDKPTHGYEDLVNLLPLPRTLSEDLTNKGMNKTNQGFLAMTAYTQATLATLGTELFDLPMALHVSRGNTMEKAGELKIGYNTYLGSLTPDRYNTAIKTLWNNEC